MFKSINKIKIVQIFSFLSLFIYSTFFLGKYLGYFDTYWIFFSRDDQFADFHKLIYSFSHLFSNQDLISLSVPKSLSNPLLNPYSVVLENGATPNMGHPPLTIILLISSALIAKSAGLHYSLIYIFYIFAFGLFLFKFYYHKLRDNPFLIFILLSYPLLFLVDRGNIWAAISGCCLLVIFKSFVKNQELTYLDLIMFILASSIRPNYLVFGLLFLTNVTVRSTVRKLFKVGIYFVGANSLFLYISTTIFPGYNLGYFVYLVDRYAQSEIRFNAWNSSLHGFIYNFYSNISISSNNPLPKDSTLRLEELIVGQAVNKLILIIYFSILIISFINFKLYRLDKISFLTILCCFTAISTSPFGDYHLIIFIFLFFTVYEYSKNDKKSILQLTLIAIIILPKFHSISPEINIHNVVNVLCLNGLLFASYIKHKTNNLS